jgi:drug/metabolite transporter (DMT)-like permease
MDRILQLRIALALAAVYIVWGSTYLAIRYALIDLPPFLMAGTRFLVAGGLLMGFLLLKGERLPVMREWAGATLLGGLFFLGGNGLVVFAEQWVVSSLAALAVASMPLWLVTIGKLRGRPSSMIDVIAIVIGFIGVAVLLRDAGFEAILHPASIALLCAPICWALGSSFSEEVQSPKGLMGVGAEMFCGGLLLLLVALVREEAIPEHIGWVSISAWVYQVVFGSLIAFSAYRFLLKHARPAVASSYAFVNPPVAVLLGVLLAGEVVGAYGYVAMVLIVGAVGLLKLHTPDTGKHVPAGDAGGEVGRE